MIFQWYPRCIYLILFWFKSLLGRILPDQKLTGAPPPQSVPRVPQRHVLTRQRSAPVTGNQVNSKWIVGSLKHPTHTPFWTGRTFSLKVHQIPFLNGDKPDIWDQNIFMTDFTHSPEMKWWSWFLASVWPMVAMALAIWLRSFGATSINLSWDSWAEKEQLRISWVLTSWRFMGFLCEKASGIVQQLLW